MKKKAIIKASNKTEDLAKQRFVKIEDGTEQQLKLDQWGAEAYGGLFAKLDDPAFLGAYDSSNSLASLARFSEQCRDAWRLGTDAGLPMPSPGGFKNVLLMGMGGSAIGGDLTKDYAKSRCSVPVEMCKGYTIPHWVSPQTLAIAVSHSGNTAETISCYLKAKQAGAVCVVLTGGGTLAGFACKKEDGIILIPQVLPPRSSMAYLTLPLLLVLEAYGLISVPQQELVNIIQVLNQLTGRVGPEVLGMANPAKVLAALLYQKLPLIWGVGDSTGTMAYRWKSQLNENSKTPAFFNIFPELNHNEIMGIEVLPKLQEDFAVVILRSMADSLAMANRIEITKDLWQSKVGVIVDVWAEGKSALAKLFYLILLGDYASTYLACLYQVDPNEILLISELKDRLKPFSGKGGKNG